MRTAELSLCGSAEPERWTSPGRFPNAGELSWLSPQVRLGEREHPPDPRIDARPCRPDKDSVSKDSDASKSESLTRIRLSRGGESDHTSWLRCLMVRKLR